MYLPQSTGRQSTRANNQLQFLWSLLIWVLLQTTWTVYTITSMRKAEVGLMCLHFGQKRIQKSWDGLSLRDRINKHAMINCFAPHWGFLLYEIMQTFWLFQKCWWDGFKVMKSLWLPRTTITLQCSLRHSYKHASYIQPFQQLLPVLSGILSLPSALPSLPSFPQNQHHSAFWAVLQTENIKAYLWLDLLPTLPVCWLGKGITNKAACHCFLFMIIEINCWLQLRHWLFLWYHCQEAK